MAINKDPSTFTMQDPGLYNLLVKNLFLLIKLSLEYDAKAILPIHRNVMKYTKHKRAMFPCFSYLKMFSFNHGITDAQKSYSTLAVSDQKEKNMHRIFSG